MIVCALTLLVTTAYQDPSPVLDGPFLIRSVEIWQPTAAARHRSGVLIHRNGSVELIPGEINPNSYPEAHWIEAEPDWVLYPGLVHGNLPMGRGDKPTNPYQGTTTDPTEGPITAMEYGKHASFFGWLNAADQANWDPGDADSWRAAGFTSGVLLPRQGLLQGQASHLALNGQPLAEAIYQRIGPSLLSLRGNGGYPNTSMAALAMLRQVLLDQGRPDLSPDLQLGQQILVRATGARAIENILDLQQDFSSPKMHWVILGGHQAWKHAARLKAQNVEVLYLLDIEDAPKSEEDLSADDGEGRPWWQDPLRLRQEKRREHQQQVEDYLLLRKAGVSCALVPPNNLKNFQSSIKQLEEAGDLSLSPDALYQDLSSGTLQLLGFSASPSDFVLSRGPYSFAEPNLAWVFSRGHGWNYAEDEDADSDEDSPDKSDSDTETPHLQLSGVWQLTVQTPMGDEIFSVDLDPEASAVVVFKQDSPKDRNAASGVKFQGNRVKFGFHIPEPEMDATVFLKLEDGRMRGKMKTPFGDVPVTGEPGPGASATAGDKKIARDTDAVDADKPQAVTGHPAWPVETRMDRFAHSPWAQKREKTVVFRGATLYRMDGSPPAIGDLLILEGIITQIGSGFSVPENVPEVDASGWHIMPGIIDAHSHLALDAINEGSVSISAECRIADMIHPESVSIWRAAAGGTALLQALHGSANPIGGQAATWELDYLATAIADLLVPGAPRNIKFALGENVKQSNWESSWGKRFPNSRIGVQAVYRRAFRDAQDYNERRKRAAAGLLPGFHRDVRLEVLADVLNNTIHVQCHSYRADELLMFLGICREFGIRRPTFQHVLEGYKVAPEIAAAGAMASSFADWWAYKFEVRDAIPWNVSILDRAGVTVSINSDSDELIRRLNTEAAKGLLYGNLGWEAAMATCTINSAKQLRIEDRVGSLELGKEGTLSIFDGPPLSGYSRCIMTISAGKVLYEAASNRDSRWEDYNVAVEKFVQANTVTSTETDSLEKNVEKNIDAQEWAHWTSLGKGYASLIRNVTVHTMVGKPFLGTVLLVDGKIARVVRGNRNIELPRLEHLLTVDGTDKHLYPGFIDGLDRTGLWEYGAVRASRDDIETGTDQPDLSVATAIHADSEHIPVTRKTGVAYVLVRPDSGRIRGQLALIQLDGTTTSDLVVEADLGLFLRFPRVAGFEQADGPEVPDEVEELDQMIEDSLAYGDRMDRFAAAQSPDFRRDTKLEALLPYARGTRDIYLSADDAPTLMAARSWAQSHHLQVVYTGARDAWKIAGYLGKDHARVIVGSIHRLPGSDSDPFDAPYRCASVLQAAGCAVALATDNPEVTRNLPFQAATATAWGLERKQALHCLTLGAAEILGVDRFIGSIEKGKVATLFLTAGDPLLIQDPVEQMWIAGRPVDLSSKQTRLRDRYLQRLK